VDERAKGGTSSTVTVAAEGSAAAVAMWVMARGAGSVPRGPGAGWVGGGVGGRWSLRWSGSTQPHGAVVMPPPVMWT